jgi:hypothetical protein
MSLLGFFHTIARWSLLMSAQNLCMVSSSSWRKKPLAGTRGNAEQWGHSPASAPLSALPIRLPWSHVGACVDAGSSCAWLYDAVNSHELSEHYITHGQAEVDIPRQFGHLRLWQDRTGLESVENDTTFIPLCRRQVYVFEDKDAEEEVGFYGDETDNDKDNEL